MKVRERNETHITFDAEEGDQLVVSYDNRGEPYREGISFALHEPDKPWRSCVFLSKHEAQGLAAMIDKLFPRAASTVSLQHQGGK
jgi:hypothetical protein